MARPPLNRKTGPMTATERQRRWRAKVRRRKDAEPKLAKLRLKQQRRAERERLLGAKQQALPDLKFGVIVEDFEWDYEVHSRETGMDRHAANHYPVAENAHTAEQLIRTPFQRRGHRHLCCGCADW
jgi:hypothetical protein